MVFLLFNPHCPSSVCYGYVLKDLGIVFPSYITQNISSSKYLFFFIYIFNPIIGFLAL